MLITTGDFRQVSRSHTQAPGNTQAASNPLPSPTPRSLESSSSPQGQNVLKKSDLVRVSFQNLARCAWGTGSPRRLGLTRARENEKSPTHSLETQGIPCKASPQLSTSQTCVPRNPPNSLIFGRLS